MATTIELYNTTDQRVYLSGWYLSDDPANLMKYQIHDGTFIEPGGYLVLTQRDNFGNDATDPGRLSGFGLSEYGDDVYLSSNASEASPAATASTSISAARRTASRSAGSTKTTGNTDFTLLASRTFGTWQVDHFTGEANSDPYQSPLVISEIMYHPANPTVAENPGGTRNDDDFEYVKIVNRSGTSQTLNDFTVTGGIGLTFGWVAGDYEGGTPDAYWTQSVGATATWSTNALANDSYHVYAIFQIADPLGVDRDLDDVAAVHDHLQRRAGDRHRQSGRRLPVGS